LHLNIQDFARLAFGKHFKWPATDLAVSRKPLRRNARIDHKLKGLAAVWALDGFGNFHVAGVGDCVREGKARRFVLDNIP
jgi:hypothetical protein